MAKSKPRQCSTRCPTRYQKLRVRTLYEKFGDVQTKALFNTMQQSLAEVKAKTPGDTLLNAEDEVPSDTLADRLKEVQAKKVRKTLMTRQACH